MACCGKSNRPVRAQRKSRRSRVAKPNRNVCPDCGAVMVKYHKMDTSTRRNVVHLKCRTCGKETRIR